MLLAARSGLGQEPLDRALAACGLSPHTDARRPGRSRCASDREPPRAAGRGCIYTFRSQELHRILEEELVGVELCADTIYDLLHRLDFTGGLMPGRHEQGRPVQEFLYEIIVGGSTPSPRQGAESKIRPISR